MPHVGFPGRPEVLSRFVRIIPTGDLGQSYLFVGPRGAGKEVTALEIARLANCPREPACVDLPLCESCQKAITYQHPDIRWLGPAPATATAAAIRELLAHKQKNCFFQPAFAASSRISIGNPDDPGPLSVRSLLRFLRVHAFQGRYKVAVVADAHRLTAEAANALLKTLEEPPPASLIFLLTSNRSAILPTVLSRCQQVRFDPYPEDELARLLQQYAGVDAATAGALARSADGNARHAMALLQPVSMALLNWAGQLLENVHNGRAGVVHLAADALHMGRVPPDAVPPPGDPVEEARELADRRQRAIQLCEMLSLYYSELLACRERQDAWQPRLPEAAEPLRKLAARRNTSTLLQDISRLETAKDEIDRNLNIGLCMAALFQGLLDNAKQDQETRRTRV